LNALEQALRIKDKFPGTTVTILSMGPHRAAEIIRDAMFRGADGGVLLTDRKFAGADTLATSYALACAAKKIAPDMIIAGRQAIDGDTAQVGSQVAEKLGWPQITYAEDIMEVSDKGMTVKRRLENGIEVVTSPLPAVVTVNGSAAECRPQNARRIMKYKHALIPTEVEACAGTLAAELAPKHDYLQITEWGADAVNPDPSQLGLEGSPTKVKKIENVVFQLKESKCLSCADDEINSLIVELLETHTLG
jgi:electron transfer flavoprotein beta subunit